MIPITIKDRILSDTFKYTLNHVIDNLDLSVFDKNYPNDETGAPVYNSAILLKAILFTNSKGIISSRKIVENVRTPL